MTQSYKHLRGIVSLDDTATLRFNHLIGSSLILMKKQIPCSRFCLPLPDLMNADQRCPIMGMCSHSLTKIIAQAQYSSVHVQPKETFSHQDVTQPIAQPCRHGSNPVGQGMHSVRLVVFPPSVCPRPSSGCLRRTRLPQAPPRSCFRTTRTPSAGFFQPPRLWW